MRRNVLVAPLEGQSLVLPARRLAADGLEAWAQVLERGYEGLVGKDEASPYREGRTLAWLKVKQVITGLRSRDAAEGAGAGWTTMRPA